MNNLDIKEYQKRSSFYPQCVIETRRNGNTFQFVGEIMFYDSQVVISPMPRATREEAEADVAPILQSMIAEMLSVGRRYLAPFPHAKE